MRSRTSIAASGAACCIRWATTRSACRPRTTRSRPACIRACRRPTSIASFQRQFRSWGISIDWSRELATSEPSYYRWTQWIFLELFRAGLAYRKEAAVKWCPHDQTVLANEQVDADGRCERCGSARRGAPARAVVPAHHRLRRAPAQRPRRDRLAGERQDDAAQLDRALRGRRGDVPLRGAGHRLPGVHDPSRHAVRRDLLRDGARAPRRAAPGRRAPSTSRRCASTSTSRSNETNEERGNAEKPKTGVALGRTVTNPVNGEQIPMYVADYVLMEYGTGAIMAVPGARRARLRVRARVRAADPARDRAGRARPARRTPMRCRTPATACSSTRARTSTAWPTARR